MEILAILWDSAIVVLVFFNLLNVDGLVSFVHFVLGGLIDVKIIFWKFYSIDNFRVLILSRTVVHGFFPYFIGGVKIVPLIGQFHIISIINPIRAVNVFYTHGLVQWVFGTPRILFFENAFLFFSTSHLRICTVDQGSPSKHWHRGLPLPIFVLPVPFSIQRNHFSASTFFSQIVIEGNFIRLFHPSPADARHRWITLPTSVRTRELGCPGLLVGVGFPFHFSFSRGA